MVTSVSRKISLCGLALAPAPLGLWSVEWVQAHPILALAILIIWEVVVVVVAFGQDVWAKVRPTLVDRVANSVAFRIDCLILGHRKQYLQDAIYQHRVFEVKGLSTQAAFALDLDQVFVDLSVAPIAPHDASANMIRKLPHGLREGRHSIWDFLGVAGQGTAKLVLLGAPGSGKTTLLKHIALTFAHSRSPSRDLKARYNLPILLFLREHAAELARNGEARMSDLIAGFMKRERQLDIPGSWFEKQLKAGLCIVMLDGLDEVVDAGTRSKISTWVDRQMSIHCGNRFIITSRPHGYRENPLSGVNVLEVRPFTTEQVSDFVHRWYVATEIRAQQREDLGVRRGARTGARDLLNRLHGAPALFDLAVNPLLLTMIATVHRYRSSLPGRRVDLYKEICDVSLGKRQQSKGIELHLTPAQKQRVLEPLAWEMMSSRKQEISLSDACSAIKETLVRVNQGLDPKSFLVSVENDSSLFREKEAGGIYAFAHLSFQEFLAACHAKNEQRRIDLLTRKVGDGWWTECIRLFAATGDATPILRACINKGPLDPEALVLALQCNQEAERKDPAVEAELKRTVDAGLNENDPARRAPVAEAFLKMRLGQMSLLGDDRYIDPEFVSHAEYQLFVDEQQLVSKDCRPIHWKTYRFPDGHGATPVLGLSFLDALAFCRWLNQREGGDWRFRLPSSHERESPASNSRMNGVIPWTTTGGLHPVAASWPEPVQARQREIVRSQRSLHRARNVALVARDVADDVLTGGSTLAGDPVVRDLAYAFELARHVVSAVSDSDDIDLAREADDALDRYLDDAFDAGVAFDVTRSFGFSRHAINLANALGVHARDLAGNQPELLPLLLLLFFLHMGGLVSDPSDRISSLTRARRMGFQTYIIWMSNSGTKKSWWQRWMMLPHWMRLFAFRRAPAGLAITAAQDAIWDLHMSVRLARARLTGADPPFEALQLVKEPVSQTEKIH